MRKLKVLALMVLVYGSVWGQTRVPNDGASPIYYIAGSVGIGTNDPLAKFHIKNGNNSYGAILSQANESNFQLYTKTLTTSTYSESFRLGLKYGNNEKNGYISFYRGGSVDGGFLGFSTNGAERIRIDHIGRVGIGTSSPFSGTHNYGIHIAKGAQPSLLLGSPMNGYGGIIQNSDGRHRVFIGANLFDDDIDSWKSFQPGKGTAGISILADNGDWGTGIAFMASNEDNKYDTRMYINSEGNVGIGTTKPAGKLHVEDGNIYIKDRSNSKVRSIFFTPSDNSQRNYIQGYQTAACTPDYLQLGSSYGSVRFTSEGASSPKENMRILRNGNVGIGTTTPDYKLDVCGTVRAKEVKVEEFSCSNASFNGTLAANNITLTTNGNTADFVFSDSYQLRNLSEVESFIKTNKHLPEIPSATQMEEQGVNLAEMNKLLLQKVEELTLYAIQQNAEVERQKLKVESLEEERKRETEDRNKETAAREKLEKRLERLEALLLNSEK